MKQVIVLVIGITVFAGCNTSPPDTTPIEPQNRTVALPDTSIVLSPSEPDRFHAGSPLESVRKDQLVKFGNNPTPLSGKPQELNAIRDIVSADSLSFVPVMGTRNFELTKPAYPFDFEGDIDALKRLAKDHGLDTLLTGGMGELDQIAALAKYTYEFLKDGRTPEPGEVPGPSAEVITRLRREEGIGGTSREYAALLCQLALSQGFTARLVSMHRLDDNGVPVTHTVCEVFLTNSAKWAVFDAAMRATYYLRDNVPLSALELRELMLANNYRVIVPVIGYGDFFDTVSVREEVLPSYRYLYLWRMNNFLEASPPGGTISWNDLVPSHLVWEDNHSLMADGAFDQVPWFRDAGENGDPAPVRFVAHDKRDFTWQPNVVSFRVQRQTLEEIILTFDTLTPNFDYFEVDHNSQYYIRRTHSFTVVNNFYSVYIRTVNLLGKKGPVAVLYLYQ